MTPKTARYLARGIPLKQAAAGNLRRRHDRVRIVILRMIVGRSSRRFVRCLVGLIASSPVTWAAEDWELAA